jgi:hypothetical protein
MPTAGAKPLSLLASFFRVVEAGGDGHQASFVLRDEGGAEVVERHAHGGIGRIRIDDAVEQARICCIGELAVLVGIPVHPTQVLVVGDQQAAHQAFFHPGGGDGASVLGAELAEPAAGPQREPVGRLVFELCAQAEFFARGVTQRQGGIGVAVFLRDRDTLLRTNVLELESTADVELETAVGGREPRCVAKIAAEPAMRLPGPASTAAAVVVLRSGSVHGGELAALRVRRPDVRREIDEIVARGLVAIARRDRVDLRPAQRVLMDAGGTEAEDARRHDLADAPVVAAIAELQRVAVGGPHRGFQQDRFDVRGRVEYFFAGVVGGCNRFLLRASFAFARVVVVDAVAVLPALAREIVALLAVCKGAHEIDALAGEGQRGAAGVGAGAEEAATLGPRL